MEINTFCPECGNGFFLRDLPKPSLIPCQRCGKGREAAGQGRLDAQGAIEICGLCGCERFYRQKDFNTKLGLWIAGLILTSAFVFLLMDHLKTGLIILVAGALVDLALYFFLGDIVICYKCRAIYRGMPINPKVEGFDLKIHDEYEFNKKSKL